MPLRPGPAAPSSRRTTRICYQRLPRRLWRTLDPLHVGSRHHPSRPSVRQRSHHFQGTPPHRDPPEGRYARMIPWSKLKANLPDSTIKLSPFAVIPHKRRLFFMILDLSFCVRKGSTIHIPQSTRDNNRNQQPPSIYHHGPDRGPSPA
jgi:hypothetical protein